MIAPKNDLQRFGLGKTLRVDNSMHNDLIPLSLSFMLSFSPAPPTHVLHELHWKVFIEKMLQGNVELSLWFGKEEIKFSQME